MTARLARPGGPRAGTLHTLHAPGLVLEPLCAVHADELFAVLADPALYAHIGHAPPASVDVLREVYRALESRRSPDGREAWLNWVLRDVAGRALGYVQATVLPHGRAWVAYVLGTAYQGHGHAGRATRAMIEHLRTAHGVRLAMACVEHDNTRSIRLLERLGFRPATPIEAAAHRLEPAERLFLLPDDDSP
jgi:[ribosomal protein S5]-alanine N-acetyltransferase